MIDNSNLITIITGESTPTFTINNPNHFLRTLPGTLRIEGITEAEKFMNGTSQYYIDGNNLS